MEFNLEFEVPGMVCEPEVAYKVNSELNRAWDIVENTGANLFLTGRAGTGKTTFLKKFRELSAKRMVVLAPTGIAAINASGITLHSFFQLPFAPFIPGKGFATNEKKFYNVSRQKRRLISSLSMLVIDEISMVRPDTLDAIDSILRRLRGSNAPFGGLQLLLIGDLRQLPPVVKDNEWNLVKDYYATPYFFESHALKKAGFHSIELNTVYRQSDAEFLALLNSIRDGVATADTLTQLNRRYRPDFRPDDSEGYIRLTTHNRTAHDLNFARLAALPTEEFSFEAEVEGEFPESSFPAEKILRLKEGAQVMFVKNDTGTERRFYNGLIGKVVSLSEEKIIVRPINSDELIEVEKAEWENTRYSIDEATKGIMQNIVGMFRQYPLQLAWAITIHKSQGLTFDKAIIDAAHSFAPGQTYVALSRCRTLDGLVLGTILPPRAVITDAGVNDFINYCASQAPDDAVIDMLKDYYAAALLRELFDFNPLKNAYNDFYRSCLEYLVPVYPHIEETLREMRERIDKEVAGVAARFLAGMSQTEISAGTKDPESALSQRIKKGCRYFLDILEDIVSTLKSLPNGIDNVGYAQILNNAFMNLRDIMKVKMFLLEYHSEETFTVGAFIQAKGKAALVVDVQPVTPRIRKTTQKHSRATVQPVQSPKTCEEPEAKEDVDAEDETETTEPVEKKKKKAKKPKGYSTFETLKRFQEGKDIETIAQERRLALSTISSHITDLIRMGRVKPEELADAATVETIRKEIAANHELSYSEIEERIKEQHSDIEMPPYLFGILYRITRDAGV